MSLFTPIANSWIANQRPYQLAVHWKKWHASWGVVPASRARQAGLHGTPGAPSPRAMAAMREAIPHMHLYPDGGAFYLRQAIAKKFGVADNMVMMGCGSNEHIVLLAHAHAGR